MDSVYLCAFIVYRNDSFCMRVCVCWWVQIVCVRARALAYIWGATVIGWRKKGCWMPVCVRITIWCVAGILSSCVALPLACVVCVCVYASELVRAYIFRVVCMYACERALVSATGCILICSSFLHLPSSLCVCSHFSVYIRMECLVRHDTWGGCVRFFGPTWVKRALEPFEHCMQRTKEKKKTRKLSWMVDNGFLHIGLTRPMNDMVMTDFGHGRLSILWPSRNWHGPIECGDVFQQARTRTLVLWQWMIDDTECWLVLYVLFVLVQSHAS